MMVGYKTIVVLLLLGCVSYSLCVEVASCPDRPRPKWVSVEGCDEEPCTLYNGVGGNFNITFESLTNTYTLKPAVGVMLGNAAIPYPLPPELQDACKFLLNGYCPIEKGEILVYNLKMPIDYPTVPVRLQFALVGDNDFVYSCFRLRIVVSNLPDTK